jgi:hypothetical protein
MTQMLLANATSKMTLTLTLLLTTTKEEVFRPRRGLNPEGLKLHWAILQVVYNLDFTNKSCLQFECH